MKLKDIIKQVSKSKEFESEVWNITEMFNLNLSFDTFDKQDRLKAYFIGNWYCTDSRVGFRVYFMDDEPVAVSSQMGRKCDEDFEWVSKEAFLKVFHFILSFKLEENHAFKLIDMEEDIDPYYTVSYHTQLFEYHKKIPVYKGETVKIIEFHPGQIYNKRGQYEPSLVKIQDKNKKEKWVNLENLKFPFNLKEQVET